MTLQIPGPLQWLAYLTGSEWPQGDESAMFRIAQYWRDSADELAELIPELNRVRHQTSSVLSGATADAAAENFRLLFDGDYSVDKLADAMSALGELCKNAGTEIEYTKLQIITSLAIAGAEIAYAIACAPATFGGSLSWIPPIEAITLATVRVLVSQLLKRLTTAVTEALTRTAVKKLIKATVKEAVQETAESFGQELLIQQIQIGQGHRDGVDWQQLKNNAIGGGAGGAAGGLAHGPLKKALGGASSVVGKATKGALVGYGSGIAGNVVGSIASDGGLTAGGLDSLSIFGGASTQAISGAFHGTGHPEPATAIDGPGAIPQHGDIAPGDATNDPKILVDTDKSNLPGKADDGGSPEDVDAPPSYSTDSPPAYVAGHVEDPSPGRPAASGTPARASSHGVNANGAASDGAVTGDSATAASGTNKLGTQGMQAQQAGPTPGATASGSGGVSGPVALVMSGTRPAGSSTGDETSLASRSSTGSIVSSPDSGTPDNAGPSSTNRPSLTPGGLDARGSGEVEDQTPATRSAVVSPRSADAEQLIAPLAAHTQLSPAEDAPRRSVTTADQAGQASATMSKGSPVNPPVVAHSAASAPPPAASPERTPAGPGDVGALQQAQHHDALAPIDSDDSPMAAAVQPTGRDRAIGGATSAGNVVAGASTTPHDAWNAFERDHRAVAETILRTVTGRVADLGFDADSVRRAYGQLGPQHRACNSNDVSQYLYNQLLTGRPHVALRGGSRRGGGFGEADRVEPHAAVSDHGVEIGPVVGSSTGPGTLHTHADHQATGSQEIAISENVTPTTPEQDRKQQPETSSVSGQDQSSLDQLATAYDTIPAELDSDAESDAHSVQSETDWDMGVPAGPDPVVIVGGRGDVEVPKALHFVWLGGPMSESARANLTAWAGRAHSSGWGVRVWTDASALDAPGTRGLLARLNNEFPGVVSHRPIVRALFNRYPGGSIIGALDSNAKALYDLARQKEAWNLASDVARYHILHKHGGVYLDVDIAPGGVVLPQSISMSLTDPAVPFLAPQLRDQSTVIRVHQEIQEGSPRRDGDEDDPNRPVGSLSSADVSDILQVVDYLYQRSQFNNNLIVTPPGSPFLQRLIDHLPKATGPHKPMTLTLSGIELVKNSPFLTGPTYLKRQIVAHLVEAGTVPATTRSGDLNDGRIQVDPQMQAIWRVLDFLTPESEAQLDHV